MKKCQNCSQYLLLKNTRGKSKPELWSPCYLWIVTLLPSSTYLLSVLCSFPWIFKQRRDWLMRLLTIHTGKFNAHLLAYSSGITVSMAFFILLCPRRPVSSSWELRWDWPAKTQVTNESTMSSLELTIGLQGWSCCSHYSDFDICFVLQKEIYPPEEECYVRLFFRFFSTNKEP